MALSQRRCDSVELQWDGPFSRSEPWSCSGAPSTGNIVLLCFQLKTTGNPSGPCTIHRKTPQGPGFYSNLFLRDRRTDLCKSVPHPASCPPDELFSTLRFQQPRRTGLKKVLLYSKGFPCLVDVLLSPRFFVKTVKQPKELCTKLLHCHKLSQEFHRCLNFMKTYGIGYFQSLNSAYILD